MKRSDMIRSIQVRFGRMRTADAAGILDNIISTITDGISRGDKVEIRGFGVWARHTSAAKDTFNPRTGLPMRLESRRTIFFKPSVEMIKKMNEN